MLELLEVVPHEAYCTFELAYPRLPLLNLTVALLRIHELVFSLFQFNRKLMKVALEILELSIYMLQLSVLVPELGCELLHSAAHFIV